MSAILMATRQWVNEQIQANVASATTSIFQWKGDVASFANLPVIPNSVKEGVENVTGQDDEHSLVIDGVTYKVGYVYNTKDTGANYVLTSRELPNSNPKKFVFSWDKFSENDYASVKAAVEALQSDLGSNDTEGVRKRVKDLETAVGDASSGLTKGVADNADAITAETTRATAAEGALADRATALETAVGDANSGLTKGVADNASAITAETTRATGAEGALADRATALETAVGDASSGLTKGVADNADAIAAEKTRAEGAEGALATSISTEKTNLTNGTTQFTKMYVAKNGVVTFETANKVWELVVDESTGTLALEDKTPAAS